MNRELASRNSDELVGQLKERWNVGKATVYQRLKHLGFAIRKIDGESFLYSNELSTLDELDDWIKAGNILATFPTPGALVQSETQEIDRATIELDPVEKGYQLRQLVRTAQEKAASLLIAQNLIATQRNSESPHPATLRVGRDSAAMERSGVANYFLD